MADACSVAAGRAISQIEKIGKQAIEEAIEGAKIKSKRIRKALSDEIQSDYEEYLKNLREQLSPENIVDEGQIANIDVQNQRQIFNMVERVRTTKNTVEQLDAVFKTSKDKSAVEGGLREVLSLKEKVIEAIRVRIANLEDRIMGRDIRGRHI